MRDGLGPGQIPACLAGHEQRIGTRTRECQRSKVEHQSFQYDAKPLVPALRSCQPVWVARHRTRSTKSKRARRHSEALDRAML
jgi:hypothetical protein